MRHVLPLLFALLLAPVVSIHADEAAAIDFRESFNAPFDAKRFTTRIPNKNTEIRDGVLWTHGSSGGKYPPMVYLPVEGDDLTISFRYRHRGEGGWLWFFVDGDDGYGSVDHMLRVKILRNGVQLQIDSHSLDANHPMRRNRDRPADPVSGAYRLNESLPLEQIDLRGSDWRQVRIVFQRDSAAITVGNGTWTKRLERPSFKAAKRKLLWMVNGGEEGIEIDDIVVQSVANSGPPEVVVSPIAETDTLGELSLPDPLVNPGSRLMLNLPGTGTDPTKIDFSNLPRVPATHAMISDVRDRGGNWVHQHAYVAHHDGRYWAMWSDGPGVRRANLTADQHRNVVPGHDQADTRVSYATSEDGLNWSKPAALSGPPRSEGYGWIARGMWQREGELLALASHFKAPGYDGEGLSLEAFRWDKDAGNWKPHGTVRDDSMNNFPPKKLPGRGEWMMTRRDHLRQVSVMVGGVESFDDWDVRPMARYDGNGRPEEPYWYVLPDGRNLVGLIRDNGRSGRLLRTLSTDRGQSWSPVVKTNFPDATSKFFALRTSRGYFVLVSNSNPDRRDPLTLAISRDGLVYTDLLYLVGGRHVDYPHLIEHDGHLLIAFSGAKQTMEVLKVALDDVDKLIGPEVKR